MRTMCRILSLAYDSLSLPARGNLWRPLAWDLLPNNGAGRRAATANILSCPAKCRRLAPAFETSRARGLFWRLARAGPIWPAQAFVAIAETLPLGSVAIEPERAPDGSVGVWLDHATFAKRPSLPAWSRARKRMPPPPRSQARGTVGAPPPRLRRLRATVESQHATHGLRAAPGGQFSDQGTSRNRAPVADRSQLGRDHRLRCAFEFAIRSGQCRSIARYEEAEAGCHANGSFDCDG
jgi:hypothetical protein